MCLGGLLVLAFNIEKIPEAIYQIVHHAFSPTAAAGGFAGATLMLGIQMGVARGIFSNEAGLGSAPIAHAAAQSNDPIQQGTVAMLGTFIDTIIICTITGLGHHGDGRMDERRDGRKPVLRGLQQRPSLHRRLHRHLRIGLFAFTTILGWSVYGERCMEYLFGVRAIVPFRMVWVAVIPVGAMLELDFIWLVADTLNALMAIPNLVALLLLSPVVFRMTRDYFADPINRRATS
jgi:alanine or glycine:cation symporter, AGCS family